MSSNIFASPYTPVPRVVLDEELHQLEKRAACIHLSLAALANRAGVRVSQISQWRSGSAVTGMTFGRHFRALQQALEAEERELLRYLQEMMPRSRALRCAREGRRPPTSA
jgi:transcriptional regulator with XRE-family HTH domain